MIPVGIQSPLFNHYDDFTGRTGKRYSYKISFLNNQYKETGLSNSVSAATKAMTDDQLLTMVQEACFRYYWEGAETISGLAKENIPGQAKHDRSRCFGLWHHGFDSWNGKKVYYPRTISRNALQKLCTFLERAEKFHGAFAHFIDGPTGKVEPFFGMQGIMVVILWKHHF